MKKLKIKCAFCAAIVILFVPFYVNVIQLDRKPIELHIPRAYMMMVDFPEPVDEPFGIPNVQFPVKTTTAMASSMVNRS